MPMPYNGEPFIINRIETLRTTKLCAEIHCSAWVMPAGTETAMVDFKDRNNEPNWTMMHPKCAEESPQNVERIDLEAEAEKEDRFFGFNKVEEDTENEALFDIENNSVDYKDFTSSGFLEAARRGEFVGIDYDKNRKATEGRYRVSKVWLAVMS